MKLSTLVKTYPLPQLDYLVIDEADKLCEMGFLEQVQEIIKGCQGGIGARCLFSATMQPGIEEEVRRSIMGTAQCLKVQIGIRNTTASAVEQ